jgi:cellulose synthase/poly-beta-1,6-N-acetylglucosamine synthase-like glycosyltransferase
MVVLTGIFILYFLLLVILLVGWNHAMQGQKEPAPGKEQFITVIVAVRNEELTIGNLLTDLSHQDFKKFETIVVNDHSEDETLWVLSKAELKNLHVINNKGTGKKAAISTAMRIARGSIIVTTDADCSVPREWLKHIHEQFKNKKTMMTFGGVRMAGDDSFFTDLQVMEFSSLIGAGAATAALGAGTMCNGANLAFRKNVFLEVKGYQDNLSIPSGDDEFLMHKIQKRYPRSVHFLNHPFGVVTTAARSSVEGFFHQRIRWASKWRYNSFLLPKVLAVVIFFIQLCFLINWVLVFVNVDIQALFILSIKVILEAAFLLQVCRFLQARWNWLAFFGLQFLYPLYVITIAAGSFFIPFQWKNRIFKPRSIR